MPYASLDEIYGEDFIKQTRSNLIPDKYKDITNNIINYNNYTDNYDNNIENFYDIDDSKLENLDDSDDDYIDEEFDNKDAQNCNKFLYHLSICEKCREFAKKKFHNPNNIIKISRKKTSDEILDIALFIISGIFLLFLLDIFIKLGKYIK